MIEHTIRARFPWGLLLICDEDAKEEIPAFPFPGAPVTSTGTTLVVSVLHSQVGEATVTIRSNPLAASGVLVYKGALGVPSGRLRISDAVGDSAVTLNIVGAVQPLQVYVDQAHEASHVDVVLIPD